MLMKPQTYFIKTYGCQMNTADAEKIAAYYQARGWELAKRIEEADEIVINSCVVRQSAENRVYGLINKFKKTMKKPKILKRKIILAGCMVGLYGKEKLRGKLPEVSEFWSHKDCRRRWQKTLKKNGKIRRKNEHAFVVIMEGCDNFCAYCVVPYSRGREKSKPIREIICEVENLIKKGVRHITLLGQNVNSYGKNHFAGLLTILNEIKGLKKISFLTSNPHDMTDDIIEAMKLPKVDRYLHLPVQSGDNEILRRMKRKYTAEQYIKLVKKIRKKIPHIKISTDIIVGFPGETEKQFQKTLDLCKKADFVKAYIAKYSPRPGTAAYRLKDDISAEEKKRRWRILEDLINKKNG